MQTIRFRMTGTYPLMLNNPQTINPMNEYNKALKVFTSKRKKTDNDQQEILRLNFLASCYYSKGQYFIPSNMIFMNFVAAAKENKLGAKFLRNVMVTGDSILEFADNNCSPEELWTKHADKYVDIRPVGIMKKMIITARMIVPEWSLEGELSFDDTQLEKSEVLQAMEIAGKRYGIGTYRQRYGRYKIEEI